MIYEKEQDRMSIKDIDTSDLTDSIFEHIYEFDYQKRDVVYIIGSLLNSILRCDKTCFDLEKFVIDNPIAMFAINSPSKAVRSSIIDSVCPLNYTLTNLTPDDINHIFNTDQSNIADMNIEAVAKALDEETAYKLAMSDNIDTDALEDIFECCKDRSWYLDVISIFELKNT